LKTPFSTEPARLEAFSDGVIAVIITIMVLELKAPHGVDFASLRETWPTFVAYLVSFVYVGIYWNNHHHTLRAVKGIDGRAMWANLHLLFWLSLVPFTTSWLGQNPSAVAPAVLYGVVLLGNAIAYTLLVFALIAVNGTNTAFAKAVDTDFKGKVSIAFYVAGIVAAFISPYIAEGLFVVVACIWFIPDPRMEAAIRERRGE
jgi:uncharacterized membrane protein